VRADVVIRRLGSDDLALARATLSLMASVFDEASDTLSDAYLTVLLDRADFWVLAARQHDVPVGGVTAHALPMTRSEAIELFIYDLAVHPDAQRQGIGRALITQLNAQAAAQGITVSFVPADVEDQHALDFYRALGAEEAPVAIFTFNAHGNRDKQRQ
jgi:aminoglycoside 3-N-acetyltransferase I